MSRQAGQLGLARQGVVDSVLARLKNTAASVYYLILERYGRKRLIAAGDALLHGAHAHAL